jgi:hypothetical protein
MEREFSNQTHCISCRKYIDEVEVRLKFLTIGSENQPKFEKTCVSCFDGKQPMIRDVYYGYGSGTHTEENICDPQTGQPIPFSSKEGKWEAMQKAGVREVGDKVHGARTTFTK